MHSVIPVLFLLNHYAFQEICPKIREKNWLKIAENALISLGSERVVEPARSNMGTAGGVAFHRGTSRVQASGQTAANQ